MKRLGKILLWLIGIIILLMIIFIGAIYIFFPKEKVKEMAIERMSETLDRDVSIEGISISLWGGVGANLEGITISNPEGMEEPYFLQAKALDVKLRFWPLLSRDVVVDRLILVEPEITLRKLQDGTINYSFAAIDTAAPPAAREKLPEESKLAATAVSFDNLTIKNGLLIYANDSANMFITAAGIASSSEINTPEKAVFRSTGKINIDSLHVMMDTVTLPIMEIAADYNITFNQPKNLLTLDRADMNINGFELEIQGRMPDFMEFSKAELVISARNSEISNFLTFIPQENKAMLGGIDLSGMITLKATLNYDETATDTITYSAEAAIKDFNAAYAEYNAEISIPETDIAISENRARLEIPEGLLLGNNFRAGAEITNFDELSIDGNISGNLNLTSLKSILPENMVERLSGNMTYDLKVSGRVEEFPLLTANGTVKIDSGSYNAQMLPEPIDYFSADMKVESRDIFINKMSLKTASSDINIYGKLSDAFPHFIPGFEGNAQKPYLTFTIQSNVLNVDKLVPTAVPGESGDPAATTASAPEPAKTGVPLPDIEGRGQATVDSLIYYDVSFSNINADIVIENQKIAVQNMNGDVYSGGVNGEMAIDFANADKPQYTGQFEAVNIETNDFLTRFTKFGGHLYGKVNLNTSVNTSGWNSDSIINSLTMDGDAILEQAKVVNFDLIQKLAEPLGYKTFEEEELKNLDADFMVEDGRVKFSNLTFDNNLGDWTINGSVGFDGSLDYSGEVLLTEKAVNDYLSGSNQLLKGLAGLLKDEESGRVAVPFEIGGSYSKPKLNIKMDILQQKIQNKLQDNAKNQVKDELEKGLKKLFGN